MSKIQKRYETKICNDNVHCPLTYEKNWLCHQLGYMTSAYFTDQELILNNAHKREHDNTAELDKGTLYESFNFIPRLLAKK